MGNKQRTYDGYDKSTGSSPTVTTKGLVLTCGIDAFEGRKLAIVDIGTAILHADNDEEVLMKLRGKIVELLVQLERTMYRKHVTVICDLLIILLAMHGSWELITQPTFSRSLRNFL